MPSHREWRERPFTSGGDELDQAPDLTPHQVADTLGPSTTDSSWPASNKSVCAWSRGRFRPVILGLTGVDAAQAGELPVEPSAHGAVGQRFFRWILRAGSPPL